MLLEIPEPYDFSLSTARFRDFGSDRATVWHDGGLHRVVAGQEVRVTAATGGVSIEPGSPEAAAEVGHLLGLPFDLDAFRGWAVRDDELGRIAKALAGFRPTLSPDPFEALVIAITTQQISLQAAAAIRANFVERFGIRHGQAWAFPTRERMREARPSHFTVLGFSRAKAEYVLELAHSDLDLATLSSRSDDEVIEDVTAIRGLGAGQPTGSSRATSPGRARGPPATSACGRPSRRFTLRDVRCRSRRYARWASASNHSRTCRLSSCSPARG